MPVPRDRISSLCSGARRPLIGLSSTILAVSSLSDVATYSISDDQPTLLAELKVPIRHAVVKGLAIMPSGRAMALLLVDPSMVDKGISDQSDHLRNEYRRPVVIILDPSSMHRFARFELLVALTIESPVVPLVFSDNGCLYFPFVAYKFSSNLDHIVYRIPLNVAEFEPAVSNIASADRANNSACDFMNPSGLIASTGHSVPLLHLSQVSVPPIASSDAAIVFYYDDGPEIYSVSSTGIPSPIFQRNRCSSHSVLCVLGVLTSQDVARLLCISKFRRVESGHTSGIRISDESVNSLQHMPAALALVQDTSAIFMENGLRETSNASAANENCLPAGYKCSEACIDFVKQRSGIDSVQVGERGQCIEDGLRKGQEKLNEFADHSGDERTGEPGIKYTTPHLLWALLANSFIVPIDRVCSLENRIMAEEYPIKCSLIVNHIVAVSTRSGYIHFVDFASSPSLVSSFRHAHRPCCPSATNDFESSGEDCTKQASIIGCSGQHLRFGFALHSPFPTPCHCSEHVEQFVTACQSYVDLVPADFIRAPGPCDFDSTEIGGRNFASR